MRLSIDFMYTDICLLLTWFFSGRLVMLWKSSHIIVWKTQPHFGVETTVNFWTLFNNEMFELPKSIVWICVSLLVKLNRPHSHSQDVQLQHVLINADTVFSISHISELWYALYTGCSIYWFVIICETAWRLTVSFPESRYSSFDYQNQTSIHSRTAHSQLPGIFSTIAWFSWHTISYGT